jgi:hypothetical protein
VRESFTHRSSRFQRRERRPRAHNDSVAGETYRT